MKFRNMLRGRLGLPAAGLAAVALIATGCAEDDTEATDTAIVEPDQGDTGASPTETLDELDETDSPTESPADGAAAGEGEFSAELQPLNDSGGSGNVTISTTQDGQISVTLNADNLAASAPHAQHIHIGGEHQCPTMDADQDGDSLISTPEGQPAYGNIEVSLTTEGDVGAESALAVPRFPTADDTGSYTYERTFDLPEGVTVDDLSQGVVVVHGIADTQLGSDPAAYDGPDSPLKAGVPQEATLPALCAELGGGTTGTTTS